MLDYLQMWNELEDASILAIFGPSCDRDTWVTEFSLDIIQAFQVQDVLVTFALCDQPGDQHWTPTTIIKKLICQLLEQKPMLIVEAPEIFNSRVFQKVTTFEEACRVFGLAIARLDSVVIIVDRVELAERDINDTRSQDFVGFLSRLVRKYQKKVRVVLTCGEEPPDALDPDLAISICMISTKRRTSRESYQAVGGCGARTKFTVTYVKGDGKETHVMMGAENLFRLMKEVVMKRVNYSITWSGDLTPRNKRERMIYRQIITKGDFKGLRGIGKTFSS